jgi:hypothetical protein
MLKYVKSWLYLRFNFQGMESDLNQDKHLVPNRTHVPNLKNKLIVLDINWVLVDCANVTKKIKSDLVFNNTAS